MMNPRPSTRPFVIIQVCMAAVLFLAAWGQVSGDEAATTTTTSSSRLESMHLAPRRELSTQEDVAGDPDIFDDGDDDDDDTNNETTCVFPDIYGDYGAETPYTDAAVVAWKFQIQGLISMSAYIVRTTIIPKLEAAVSRLLVERLFQTPVCEEDDSQYTSSIAKAQEGGTRQLRSRRRLQRNLALQFWELSNGARVSGLLVEPKDSILPHFEGVNCRDTTYIPDAPRCFRLIGGITLTGQQGNIDEAVNLTQAALETFFNDENLLNNIDEMVRNVQYMEAEPDYHVYFGGEAPTEEEPTPAPQPSPTPPPPGSGQKNDGSDDSKPKNWPIWPWLVIGSTFVLMVVALFALQRRNLGSFDAIQNRSRKKHGRLLSMQRSSDDSMDDDDDDDDGYPLSDAGLEPVSQSWRNVPTPTSSKADDISTSEGSNVGIRRPPANTTKYYSQSDVAQGVQGRSLATGSFPDDTNGVQFVDQTGEKMTSLDNSGYSSSNHSGDHRDTTSSGSSSQSSTDSTPPPIDSWNKRHVV